jgi:hypothetical protein
LAAWDKPVCGITPSSSLLGVNERVDFPALSTYELESGQPTPEWPTLLRPPITQMPIGWYRNISLFSITYAFRPRLRDRLTLRRLTLLRKPEAYGERVSRPFYRYSCQHNLFHPVHRSSRSGFNPEWNAPLPPLESENPSDPQLR